ncbi:hypothetical protein FH972_017885 [Carpinus fangiana]|uniref:Uncharacterized protein n=1 Tax=Carpinus fangiana TaxID=176857 RepID=A0A5N6RK92_9ROSI|nr:hypothetical protein FH972_017885 [Carpinus fangiana]
MGSPRPPTKYDRRIFLLNTQNKINGFTKRAINNVYQTLPATPYLGSIKYGLKNAFDQKIPPENANALSVERQRQRDSPVAFARP